MARAVCPGSFDPVTEGHVDIFGRAAGLFDEVLVAVGVNVSKTSGRLFDAQERIDMLAEACAPWDNVRVVGFTGLLTDFCREQDAAAIVKGLRGSGDLDYESQMAGMNRHLTGVETVYLNTAGDKSFISSSLVKEVASMGGDVSALVPDFVLPRLTQRLAERAAERAG